MKMKIGKTVSIAFLTLILSHIINAQDYYRTPSGEKYHLETCRMVKNTSHRLSLQEAKEMGLTPCKICKPQSHGGAFRPPKKTPGQSKQSYQCMGTTKKGMRCKHNTKIANSYCAQHVPK